MARRSSVTNVIDSGISRELGTRYENVKLVAENIDAVLALSLIDLEQVAKDVKEATDFEGISVVAGDVAGWNPVTKVITVPTLKGDKGDTGDDLTITAVIPLSEGRFTWVFSDGTEYTTPSLKGNKGDKGDKGDTGIGVSLVSTTAVSDGRFIWRYSDGSSYTTPSLTGGRGDKGDKGDTGDSITITQITTQGNGVFVWSFSDGSTYTTPSLLGPKGEQGVRGFPGVKGEQGVSVNHLRATSTTEVNGHFGVFGELDTYTFYGDAAETNVLGWFSVRNGISAETDLDALGIMRRSVYDTDNSGVVDNAERLEGYGIDALQEFLLAALADSYGTITVQELNEGLSSTERFVTASVLSAWLNGKGFMTEIPENSVANNKLADMDADTLKGRIGTSGIPQDLGAADIRSIISVEEGATANRSDGFLTARENHTGTQPLDSITGLSESLDTKVDKVSGQGLSDRNYTEEEKQKLAGLEGSRFKGEFTSLSALVSAFPNAEVGAYANVDSGEGFTVFRYIWDNSDKSWVEQIGVSTQLTGAQIKELYEDQPDTNAFTNDEKSKLSNYPDTPEPGVTSSTSVLVDPVTKEVRRAAVTGDVTIGENSNTSTIGDGVVTNTKLAYGAPQSIKGRLGSFAGPVQDLSSELVRLIINVEDGATNGADWNTNLTGVPANIISWSGIPPASKFNTPTGTESQYIRGDGTLAEYGGGGEGIPYTAGDGITLSDHEFSVPVTSQGLGSYVKSVEQTPEGILVTMDNPPGTEYDTGSVGELEVGTDTEGKLQSAEVLNSWITGKNYLTEFTESDPTVPSHVKSITGSDISTWDASAAWGDHADAGYAVQGVGTTEVRTNQQLDSRYVLITSVGQANGVPALDAGGKIPVAQLPATAITDTFPVSSQTAMLALTAQVGDVCVRTDQSRSYILRAEPATVLGNWQELLSPTQTIASTDALAEGTTNQYFTQARARGAVSSSGTLAYNNTTGVFSLPTHLNGITAANVTNWNTAFGWGSHTAAGYAVLGTASGSVRNNTELDARFAFRGTGGTQVRTNTESDARYALSAAYSNVLNIRQVQQGTGTGQGVNDVKIGWATSGGTLLLQIDNTNFGATWPIGIQGTAGAVAWANVTGKPTTFAPTAHALGTHSDVTITSPATGQLMRWNGSAWVNWTPNFLTGYTESDPTVPAHVKSITQANINTWNSGSTRWDGGATGLNASTGRASLGISRLNINHTTASGAYASSQWKLMQVDGIVYAWVVMDMSGGVGTPIYTPTIIPAAWRPLGMATGLLLQESGRAQPGLYAMKAYVLSDGRVHISNVQGTGSTNAAVHTGSFVWALN